MNRPIIERLRDKIRVSSNGCWEWKGTILKSGYGEMSIKNRKMLVHRLSYTLYYGTIPNGLFVCHRCDNRKCLNPAHLFLGTNKDNVDDMVSKGRQARGTRQGNSKLSDSEVLAIYKDTRSQRAIAIAYGVCQKHVSYIKSGKQWGWLTKCDSYIGIKDKQQKGE